MPEETPSNISLVTMSEAAERLSVTERYIRGMVEHRTIRHYKIGKYVRFSIADLDAFIASGERPAR